MKITVSRLLATACLPLILFGGCREEPAASPLYAIPVQHMDGKTGTLSPFRGDVLLLVNVASKCGHTKQYAGLQALYEKYHDRGLTILAFPANNFGGQEPGTNAQILEFCSTTYGVTFPVLAKISVKGDDIHPLYRFLTSPDTNPRFAGEIPWNFSKFLIGRDGAVLGRYEPAVQPFDERLIADIESALQNAS